MAITKKVGRQEVIAARVDITHDTLSSDAAVAEGVIQVPEGAVVVGGHIFVTEVFNSTTSDVVDIGDGVDDDRYTATPVDLTALGSTALDSAGYKYLTEDDIDVEWTAGSTGTATTGEATITVLYVVDGRAAFSEG